MFDEIIEEIVPEIGEVIKDEIRINCIYTDCPNPYRHLYFNVKKGVGFCHRCTRPTSINNLVCYYKGVSLKEAENIIVGTGQKRAEMLVSKVNKLMSPPILKIEEEEDVSISLPENFISFSSGQWDFPYLKKRSIAYEVASFYGMGFCREGKWKDRLIIPIYMDNELRGFVARSIFDPPSDLSKAGKKVWSRMRRYIKVLNPKGFNSSRLLFNFDNIHEEMIITEGIFDALRCGKNAVAMFGKHMSVFQEKLIRKKKPKKIFVMLDSDAYEDGKEIAERLSSSGLNVYLVKLLRGDPGALTQKEIKFYMSRATRISPQKIFSLKERFNNVFK